MRVCVSAAQAPEHHEGGDIAGALVHLAGPGMVGCSSLSGSDRPMPHKHNADRRHHIPKMSFKVRNWPAYEAGLRRRGSLTLWVEDAALECWQTSGPSGQARYTGAAIQTSLMLRTAFKLGAMAPYYPRGIGLRGTIRNSGQSSPTHGGPG